MSTLRVNNITDASGGSSSLNVPGTAKAWVNFNGTGTVAIRASLNVSSITDNGTGDYTVNFATALVDANYSHNTTGVNDGANDAVRVTINTAPTTTAYRFLLSNTAGTLQDSARISVAIFR